MTAHQRSKRFSRSRRPHGFSLVELMTVVLITGILASIAIPTFSGYIFKSRTSEAVHFLGVIKLKQEAYRSEFGRYAPPTGTSLTDPEDMTYLPKDPDDMEGQQETFPTDNVAWNQLGARPDAPVRFAYGWAAGTPVASHAILTAVAGYNLPTPHDHYFIAQAIADLNDNGVPCTFEVTSFTRAIWFSPSKGWE